jgi:alpha-beta hydrolase superfamily lysophospholipase
MGTLRIKLNSGRDHLSGRLDIGKKADAFLLCHGFGASMYEPEETSVMDDLTRMGYTGLLLSHRTGRPADLIFQEQIGQLVNAVTYLLEEVHVKRVHLFGISMGAANAVSTAAIDDRIASVAASSGISDCRLWMQQRHGNDFDSLVRKAARIELSQLKGGGGGKLFEVNEVLRIEKGPKVKGHITRVSARTIRSLLTYKPILAAPGISGMPAFFFHGTGDRLVSHEHTLALNNATRTEKYMLLIEGGDHEMILEKPVRDRILSFYLSHLKKGELLEA